MIKKSADGLHLYIRDESSKKEIIVPTSTVSAHCDTKNKSARIYIPPQQGEATTLVVEGSDFENFLEAIGFVHSTSLMGERV